MRLAERLAQSYLANGKAEEAESCYRQMLERDSCREEAHLGLIRAHLAANRRDQAVACYHEYCKTLERELNLAPSPEATALYMQVVES